MPTVRRTRDVEFDLLEIWLHIARDNPDAADRLLTRIEEKCESYARQPGMGDNRPELGEGVRSFPVGNYVVLYRPEADGIDGIVVLLETARMGACQQVGSRRAPCDSSRD
ncbi:MAG TPA: type II toxin-antitoxin system RelE/ParE family toxin [Planctomycetaceae bacterium]|nr:type II toxin-antitoxin system RelE/ParE family toxin [Planctomycetaceae bacterium]